MATDSVTEKSAGESSQDSSTVQEFPSPVAMEPQNLDHSHIGEQIRHLARQISNLSRYSTKSTTFSLDGSVNPFLDTSDDPRLNPHSPKFSPKYFVSCLLDICSRDPQKYPVRAAGVSFKDLSAWGYGSSAEYQRTVLNAFPSFFHNVANWITGRKDERVDILRDFEGLVLPGEMLMVLGCPGSGCTTFLKSIGVDTHGYYLSDSTVLNYQGIPAKLMESQFRGEIMYNAETDEHFPHLRVGQTLYFAALARTPHNRIAGVSRARYAEHMRDVVMAMLGLSHTINTKVGDAFVRGVSGGERKRVSIAEAMLSGAPIQCWDNSTRGLDAATAMSFVRHLRLFATTTKTTSFVSMYQASQDAYDAFDKVILLYQGRMIFFGSTKVAKEFFIDMGFHCIDRQTTGDFLTSLTNPSERSIRPGFEDKVPRTPDEFAARWKESDLHAQLILDIEDYNSKYPFSGDSLSSFELAHKSSQSRHISVHSPYMISYPMQVKLCLLRAVQRMLGDMTIPLVTVFTNFFLSLILSSLFYNLPQTTGSFYSRGVLLFFAVLLSAFSCVLEILQLYAQRPIVEKQFRYAFYHPSAEAFASIVCDLPTKILTCLSFNITLYFMSNLRREPGHFFLYLLFSFTCTLTMSMIFRTIGSVTRTLQQAMLPACVIMLLLVVYTGFVIPTRDMHGWFRWINYLNPIGYVFESFLINEFHDRKFSCSQYVPMYSVYDTLPLEFRTCSTTGSVRGQNYVLGDDYIGLSYRYYHAHLWRNYGILIGFLIFFTGTYLLAAEYIRSARSKGEVLVFQRGYFQKAAAMARRAASGDLESGKIDEKRSMLVSSSSEPAEDIHLQQQTDIFFWKNVCYDIKIKAEPRRLLDQVDGYVKPGTLTALMGASGAGKTTLLDVLASRVTMGVVSGEMLVNGHQRDSSFQRKTSYVQQSDIHLETSTVREALEFSAILRQPSAIPIAERKAYVDEVIKVLEMEKYADAIVGVPGEGLNVEQRKRLTIGVELAAKPELLLFLDEPTSGLDSQTAWSIMSLLRKLTNHGQAILCTIHQPSAVLFQQFDRLLFLIKGGRPVYFGEIGPNARTLIDYFERNGSDPCPPNANPAEWMLSVVGAAPGSAILKDWGDIWVESPERVAVRAELEMMKQELSAIPPKTDPSSYKEFSASYWLQFKIVFVRVWQQLYRTPSYILSKIGLCFLVALFIGFSFYKADKSLQGMQNQMFSIFMFFTMSISLTQQTIPNFVTQRDLYEARERPSKSYAWQTFIMANIVSEIPWTLLTGLFAFLIWYYPIGYFRNAQPMGQVNERGFLMFALIEMFMVYTSTFAQMSIAGLELADTAGNVSMFCFSMCLMFCGVLATHESMPGFWIFMYRVSPFTYLVEAMLTVGLANTEVTCSDIEYITITPYTNYTCWEYLGPYIDAAGGYLQNPNATSECSYCQVKETNVYLASLSTYYSHRWRDFGFMFIYVAFNICGAFFFYWLARVPKRHPIKHFFHAAIKKVRG
ncbi:ABC-2 type transporter-domain-containing protein [Lipomyces oligophaga]|uniref:ABC-2 type transporter-domain-containing protein n=1 Tax=Lipomyces oligophaga TaxID=45792 RepID=UPI0034CF5060